MTLSLLSDEHFMKEALKEAQYAFDEGETPVGAILVANNRIVAKAHNLVETLNDPTAHAEVLAITSACDALGTKYLNECTLYVTLEPCGMCAGASYWSRLKKIVFGASDEIRGYSSLNKKLIHPKTEIIKGILADESSALLKQFFQKLR